MSSTRGLMMLRSTKSTTAISTKALIVACAAAVLSACAVPQKSLEPMNLRHPIQIAESIERLELYSRPDGMALSARDQDAVAQFIANYAQHGDGPIYINVPNRPGMSRGLQDAQSIISSNLSRMGRGGSNVQTGQYQVAAQGPAPVIVSYRRLKTMIPDCGHLDSVNMTYNNQPYPEFGCAYNANLAAMVGDPRQLLSPYDMAPGEAARRMVVYDKYIQGENPASDLPSRQDISTEGN